MQKAHSLKKFLIFTMKILLAGGLLFILLKLDRLDLSILQHLSISISTIALCLAGISAVLLGSGFAALRLWTLLNYNSFFTSFRGVLKITFIGSLIGYILPGIVIGDVFKAVYLCRGASDRKAASVATVFVDRAIGLFSFLLLSSLALLFGFIRRYLTRDFLFLLVVPGSVAIVGIGAYVYCRFGEKLNRSEKQTQHGLKRHIRESFSILQKYLGSTRTVVLSVVYSLINHLLFVVSFIIAGHLIGDRSPIYIHFILDPLALITNAIPLTPGGLGIAESTFSLLYEMIGSSNGGTMGIVGRFFQYAAYISGGIVALVLLDAQILLFANNSPKL